MNGLVLKYFVLKPGSKHVNDDYAFASREAMLTFAAHCNNKELANDLREWVKAENNFYELMQADAKICALCEMPPDETDNCNFCPDCGRDLRTA